MIVGKSNPAINTAEQKTISASELFWDTGTKTDRERESERERAREFFFFLSRPIDRFDHRWNNNPSDMAKRREREREKKKCDVKPAKVHEIK